MARRAVVLQTVIAVPSASMTNGPARTPGAACAAPKAPPRGRAAQKS